jgi:hypothetical protein
VAEECEKSPSLQTRFGQMAEMLITRLIDGTEDKDFVGDCLGVAD